MNFVAHLSRQCRKPIERSISEHKFDNHRFQEEFRIRENMNSYQGTFCGADKYWPYH